jgi:hypothetical protein
MQIARCIPWLFVLSVVVTTKSATSAEPRPLARAHAHNDYEHERPLLDALEQGFANVEADVHLVEGELLVAHDAFQVRAGKTLEKLYLDPLQARVKEHPGSVYAEPVEFTLLVDLKTEAETTYAALDKTLAKYPKLFTQWTEAGRKPGAVTVIVSGNRPIETIAKQVPRRAGLDGRLVDLDQPTQAELMPLISDRWGAHFSWNGKGEISAADRMKLHATVKSAHERGQRIRFWATADTQEMWRELDAAGVDLINTDDLAGLATFLNAK